MSRASDTAARVLANLDGETKAESLGAEEALEVFSLVRDELNRRHDGLRPAVENLRRAREETMADRVAEARSADEGIPVMPEPGLQPAAPAPAASAPSPDEPRPTGSTPVEGNDIQSGPHGVPGVPVNAQPENTPSTNIDRAPISAAGAEGTNDV